MSNMGIDDTAIIEYDEDYSIMCDLPNEILCYIFFFLRLDDRKSVRLVSRLWYRLSTIWSITKTEKFVFRLSSHIEDIVKVMLKSNFALANLEFQGLPIVSLPVTFWRVCGPRINSLELFQCDGNDKMIKNIIIHCENLTSFTYRNLDPDILSEKILRSSRVLDKLVEKGIQRTKLRTFDVCIKGLRTRIKQSQIFLLYPGIRCLNAENISRKLFSCIPISVNSLTLPIKVTTNEEYFETFFTIAELVGLRLKCFKVVLPVDCTSHSVNESLFKFFSSQKDLEVIYLLAENLCPFPSPLTMKCNCRTIKKIIFHIFGSCPNLRKLSVPFSSDDSSELYFNWEELPRFLSSISKLQYLQIAFDIFDRPNIDWPNASKTAKIPSNLLLTALDLSGIHYEEKDHIYAILLPCCPLLRHLKLRVGSDHTLQTIFKYLLKLRTLIITHIENCSYYGFSGDNATTGEGYSIKRLQQLKHFEICGLRDIESIGKILLEFELPHLEFLNVDVGLGTVTLEVWGQILSQVPELRELILFFFEDFSEVYVEPFVQFCKHLKKLRRLHICDEPGEGEGFIFHYFFIDRFEEIFYACPNLRYLTQDIALISKLQYLMSIAFSVSDISLHETSKYLLFPNNLALTTLELSITQINIKVTDRIYTALLQHCPLLLHLKLTDVSDYTLQIIFKFLLKLQTLIFPHIGWSTDYEFTGHKASRRRGYSIKRLEELKYLKIGGLYVCKIERLQKILLEFQLPRLECLRFGSLGWVHYFQSNFHSRYVFACPLLEEPGVCTRTETFSTDENHPNAEVLLFKFLESTPLSFTLLKFGQQFRR